MSLPLYEVATILPSGLLTVSCAFLQYTASLRFQPTKRPQLSAQKTKPKSSTPRPLAAAPSTSLPDFESASVTARPATKTTLADWTTEGEDNDINGFYGGEKRQRGGRKKRKKNKEESHVPQNWDDIYDPSRPNNYEDYKRSDERIMEIREWKDKLYAHRLDKRRDSDSDSSANDHRPQLNSWFLSLLVSADAEILTEQFASPGSSLAPPSSFGDGDKSQLVEVPNDPSSDDVHARRMRVSQFGFSGESLKYNPLAHQLEPLSVSPAPPPVSDSPYTTQPHPPSTSNDPQPLSISRAPVRYNLPAPPSELPASEAELEDALRTDLKEEEEPSDTVPRSLRPGQKGFAERLMSKYGWSKGSGLGASGSGIVNPLRVQVETQKKKPDSEGGGFVGPGGRGRIIGGKKKGGPDAEPEDGKFGVMSEVVVLRGMVDGMDLDAEMEGAGDGGLMQEIGEECGEKVSLIRQSAHMLRIGSQRQYGRVERVFIDRGDASKAPVFVKFTSQLSALRVCTIRGIMQDSALTNYRPSTLSKGGSLMETLFQRGSLIARNLKLATMSRAPVPLSQSRLETFQARLTIKILSTACFRSVTSIQDPRHLSVLIRNNIAGL